MSREFKRVIWGWLPGVVAGFMPLLVFLLVRFAVIPPINPVTLSGSQELRHYVSAEDASRLWDGLTEHLLIFSIVTSCVSTFTSFPRLFAFREKDSPIGLASLGLVMGTTLILVVSVAIYSLHVAATTRSATLWGAMVLVLVTLGVTLYMEFAIANIRLSRDEVSPSPGG